MASEAVVFVLSASAAGAVAPPALPCASWVGPSQREAAAAAAHVDGLPALSAPTGDVSQGGPSSSRPPRHTAALSTESGVLRSSTFASPASAAVVVAAALSASRRVRARLRTRKGMPSVLKLATARWNDAPTGDHFRPMSMKFDRSSGEALGFSVAPDGSRLLVQEVEETGLLADWQASHRHEPSVQRGWTVTAVNGEWYKPEAMKALLENPDVKEFDVDFSPAFGDARERYDFATIPEDELMDDWVRLDRRREARRLGFTTSTREDKLWVKEVHSSSRTYLWTQWRQKYPDQMEIKAGYRILQVNGWWCTLREMQRELKEAPVLNIQFEEHEAPPEPPPIEIDLEAIGWPALRGADLTVGRTCGGGVSSGASSRAPAFGRLAASTPPPACGAAASALAAGFRSAGAAGTAAGLAAQRSRKAAVAAMAAGAGGDWYEYFDDARKLPYYFNAVTQETVWVLPDGANVLNPNLPPAVEQKAAVVKPKAAAKAKGVKALKSVDTADLKGAADTKVVFGKMKGKTFTEVLEQEEDWTKHFLKNIDKQENPQAAVLFKWLQAEMGDAALGLRVGKAQNPSGAVANKDEVAAALKANTASLKAAEQRRAEEEAARQQEAGEEPTLVRRNVYEGNEDPFKPMNVSLTRRPGVELGFSYAVDKYALKITEVTGTGLLAEWQARPENRYEPKVQAGWKVGMVNNTWANTALLEAYLNEPRVTQLEIEMSPAPDMPNYNPARYDFDRIPDEDLMDGWVRFDMPADDEKRNLGFKAKKEGLQMIVTGINERMPGAFQMWFKEHPDRKQPQIGWKVTQVNGLWRDSRIMKRHLDEPGNTHFYIHFEDPAAQEVRMKKLAQVAKTMKPMEEISLDKSKGKVGFGIWTEGMNCEIRDIDENGLLAQWFKANPKCHIKLEDGVRIIKVGRHSSPGKICEVLMDETDASVVDLEILPKAADWQPYTLRQNIGSVYSNKVLTNARNTASSTFEEEWNSRQILCEVELEKKEGEGLGFKLIKQSIWWKISEIVPDEPLDKWIKANPKEDKLKQLSVGWTVAKVDDKHFIKDMDTVFDETKVYKITFQKPASLQEEQNWEGQNQKERPNAYVQFIRTGSEDGTLKPLGFTWKKENYNVQVESIEPGGLLDLFNKRMPDFKVEPNWRIQQVNSTWNIKKHEELLNDGSTESMNICFFPPAGDERFDFNFQQNSTDEDKPVVTAELDRTSGELLGASIKLVGSWQTITNLEPNGLIPKFNEGKPDEEQIKVGMRVYSANRVLGPAKQQLEEWDELKKVDFQFAARQKVSGNKQFSITETPCVRDPASRPISLRLPMGGKATPEGFGLELELGKDDIWTITGIIKGGVLNEWNEQHEAYDDKSMRGRVVEGVRLRRVNSVWGPPDAVLKEFANLINGNIELYLTPAHVPQSAQEFNGALLMSLESDPTWESTHELAQGKSLGCDFGHAGMLVCIKGDVAENSIFDNWNKDSTWTMKLKNRSRIYKINGIDGRDRVAVEEELKKTTGELKIRWGDPVVLRKADETMLVEVERQSADQSLGMQIGEEVMRLKCDSVGEGLIGDWNIDNPDALLLPGATFTSINGLQNAPVPMLRVLKQAKFLRMIVKKVKAGKKAQKSMEFRDKIVVVVTKKSPDDSLGLELNLTTLTMMVTDVSNEGLIGQYNKTVPEEKRVQFAHRLLSANGVEGDPDLVLAEIAASMELTLEFAEGFLTTATFIATKLPPHCGPGSVATTFLEEEMFIKREVAMVLVESSPFLQTVTAAEELQKKLDFLQEELQPGIALWMECIRKDIRVLSVPTNELMDALVWLEEFLWNTPWAVSFSRQRLAEAFANRPALLVQGVDGLEKTAKWLQAHGVDDEAVRRYTSGPTSVPYPIEPYPWIELLQLGGECLERAATWAEGELGWSRNQVGSILREEPHLLLAAATACGEAKEGVYPGYPLPTPVSNWQGTILTAKQRSDAKEVAAQRRKEERESKSVSEYKKWEGREIVF